MYENSEKQQTILHELARVFTDIPFNKMLGLKLESLDASHVALSFHNHPTLIGNYVQVILHGGVISAVLDMAGGMLVMANAAHKHTDRSLEEIAEVIGKCSTIDLQISYLNPGRGDKFIAKAELLKRGNTVSFTRMQLNNQDDTLIATASATYLLK
ncbi:MAG: thioesterase family protein [Gammaproteobacteria bacterium]